MTATTPDQMTKYEIEMLRDYRAGVIEECAQKLEATHGMISGPEAAFVVRKLKETENRNDHVA